MLKTKIIFSLLIILICNQSVTQGVFFDWMMPTFVFEEPSDDLFDSSFKNGMKSLHESMLNLKDNMEKLNKEIKEINVGNFSILDLASVMYPNGTDLSSYYSLGGCDCANLTCSCCAHLEIAQLNLNDTGCVNLTYLSKDVGIEVSFAINGVVYYNKTISESNPPDVCIGIPEFKDAASLCLKFYDLIIRNNTITGCLDVIAKLANIEIVRVKVGCFRSAQGSKFFQQNMISFHSFGNTTYYNQFNTDSFHNLVLKTVSLVSNNNNNITNFVSNSNILSNILADKTAEWKLNSQDLVFKRKKRD